MKNSYRGFFVLFLFLIFGCGPQAPESVAEDTAVQAPAAQQSSQTAAPAAGAEIASITGQILFEGTAPPQTELQMDGNPECRALHPSGKILGGDVLVADGKVQNAFVYIKEGLEGKTFEPPQAPVVIDNNTCVYKPHVSGAMVHQPIELRNSDPTLHNIHAYPAKEKQWNLGLPFQGMKVVKKFSEPEVMVKLKCDVHPWMVGYLGVLPHPFFAITGRDGRFELKNLPAGSYTVHVWYERFGVESQAVQVADGEMKEISLTLKA